MRYIGRDKWIREKAKIEIQIAKKYHSQDTQNIIDIDFRKFDQPNNIYWYLYLVETFLESVEKYEPHQGARIIPIFEKIGKCLESVIGIRGIDKKIHDLLDNRIEQTDSILFEILVALLWRNNGWSSVSFIPENKREKTPDISAKDGRNEWMIECKRLSKLSNYSAREYAKWRKNVETIIAFSFQLWI